MAEAKGETALAAVGRSRDARSVRETPSERWRRRAVTVPGFLLLAAGLWLLFPALLPLALLADLVRRRRFTTTRLLVFGLVFGSCEALGLLASLVLWLASGTWAGAPRQRFERWNFALQILWASALFGAARAIFALTVSATGEEEVGERPALVFIRHASLVDTLIPAVFLSRGHRFRLRYVLKRELLWDPCLDVVGQRLPNVFVRRGSGEGEREVRAIRALAADLGPREGVVIYPEGTRASPAKRARALARIEASGDAARLDRARQLRHLLPARSGGPLGLIEAAPGVDVLFVAHVGLEGLVSVGDVLSGGLVGRRVQVAFWRVAAPDIPRERAARIAWLDAQWGRLDRWVDARLCD